MLHSGFFGLGGAAASGGGSYPNLTLTSPTFATGKFGQALSGGTATATVPVTATFGIGFWFQGTGNPYATVAAFSGFGAFGTAFGGYEWAANGGGTVGTNAPQTGGATGICDGVWHWLYIENQGTFANWWLDGVGGNQNYGTSGQSTPLGVTLAPQYIPNCLLDDLTIWNGNNSARATPPTAAQVRGANNAVIWPLDGNGTGF